MLAITCIILNLYSSGQSRISDYRPVDAFIEKVSVQGMTADSMQVAVKRKFTGNAERVRAFYVWIAHNIQYDKALLDQYELSAALALRDYQRGGSSQQPDTVIRRRLAVCEGYCKLMNKFCAGAGINSQMVPGITRLPGGEVVTNVLHTWNAVLVDSTWTLLDVTWAGGYVDARDRYIKSFSDHYFLTPPAEFVKDHWPLDAMWQLLDQPLSKSDFTASALPKPGPKFHFRDSIQAMLKLKPDDREIAEIQHYHRYDPENPLYKDGYDQLVYNRSVTHFNKSALYFEDYVAYASTLRGKEVGSKEIRRCIRLLEEPKKHLEVGLRFSQGKKFYNASVQTEFDQMTQASAKRLTEINGYLTKYRKMLASLH